MATQCNGEKHSPEDKDERPILLVGLACLDIISEVASYPTEDTDVGWVVSSRLYRAPNSIHPPPTQVCVASVDIYNL